MVVLELSGNLSGVHANRSIIQFFNRFFGGGVTLNLFRKRGQEIFQSLAILA